MMPPPTHPRRALENAFPSGLGNYKWTYTRVALFRASITKLVWYTRTYTVTYKMLPIEIEDAVYCLRQLSPSAEHTNVLRTCFLRVSSNRTKIMIRARFSGNVCAQTHVRTEGKCKQLHTFEQIR